MERNIDWSRIYNCDTYIDEHVISHHGMVMQTCIFIERTWNSECIFYLVIMGGGIV